MSESSSPSFVSTWLRERRDADPADPTVKAIAESVEIDALDESALLKRLIRLATRPSESVQP